jgi:hypothetical protein
VCWKVKRAGAVTDITVAVDLCSLSPYVKYLVLKSNSIDSTMEPIFAESASETMIAELCAQLDAAIAALPPAHCLNPTENELSDS